MLIKASPQELPKTFYLMDVLRAYACVMIVLFHAHSISKRIPTTDGSELWDSPIWWYSTVDLFFVMSGFLMVHMSRKLFGNKEGIKIFLAKRAARTPPLYWLYTIIIALLFLFVGGTSHGSDHVTLERVVKSILFWPIEGGPIIPLGWTLNFEVFFYAFFALFIPFAFPRGILYLIGFFAVLVAAGYYIEFPYFPLNFWTDPILVDFIWGLALGLLYHKGYILSVPCRVALVLLAAVPVLLVDQPFEYGDMTRPFTFGLSAAMLVAAATLREKEQTFGKAGALVAEVGYAAYSLYLTHIITLKAFELVYKKTGMADLLGPVFYIYASSICAIAVGYVAYLVIEKPLTGYLRSRVPNA